MVPQSTDTLSSGRERSPATSAPARKIASPASADQLHPDVQEVLFTADSIATRTREVGAEIAAAYANTDNLMVIGVLTGAFVYCSDLVRAIQPVPRGLTVSFIRASSYGGGTESKGTVQVSTDMDITQVKGKHVLLVEDIVDTALTISTLSQKLLDEGAASVKVATLLDKHERRKLPYQPDFVGFTCPNAFVVGYGLDFDNCYRSLPYIGVLKPELYAHLGL